MPGCSPGPSQWRVIYDLTLPGMCDFDEKMAFCDAPDHCHTFQSAPIVKYTQNGPLPDSPWSVSTSLEKSQISWGFPDQSADLMKKVAFCGAPDHSHTFQSAPIVKYTKNGPLLEARWSVSTSLKKSQIPCGFSDLWVDLVSPAGRLGRVSQRPTAPTVGGTRIRHVVQMNRLGVCYRMVMKFFSQTQNAQVPAD